ncbi:hypothetical protein POSPLADRAFT_1040054 [Postia placenta MAD-698-R-SB12]|uniref:Uncharacterized protein n=1 Tax=Postia placenta MAD-698-R-SB12 TaxID=670580 RepID=A0A1X6N1K0_9APHY|nr:hypothetical protein POSPLADRAFT_1040054 [Postia placenta MAD-698-R-SB12]OSX62499.1 hypothetical protein POSPLADRAFT_1040054 [Postia placenta MAD-698-R-SB12]
MHHKGMLSHLRRVSSATEQTGVDVSAYSMLRCFGLIWLELRRSPSIGKLDPEIRIYD